MFIQLSLDHLKTSSAGLREHFYYYNDYSLTFMQGNIERKAKSLSFCPFQLIDKTHCFRAIGVQLPKFYARRFLTKRSVKRTCDKSEINWN